MYENLPWNKPKYKPTTKISDIFWHDFISAAKMLTVIDTNMRPSEKKIRNWREPDIYAVFDKLRQDYHNELPYSAKVIAEYDRSIERGVAKELELYE